MVTRVVARLSVDDADPLSVQPPLYETPDERNARIALEEAAKARSDTIDEELERARASERRGPKPIKILLLGQSESGKSTTLKTHSFRAQRASWRAVIQLNVVRSIHSILDAMTRAEKHDHGPSSSTSSKGGLPPLTTELLAIKSRLEPLVEVEKTLIRRLTSAGSGEIEATQLQTTNGTIVLPKSSPKEVAINSTIPWRSAFNKLVGSADRGSFESEDGIDWDDPDDPGPVLHSASEHMKQLWASPIIQQLLEKENVRLEQLSGFFLDSLDRVTAARYIPTDDDILRARLKTLGEPGTHFTPTSS
ncbi:hypothetical protein NLJ89_g2124 [Agrocybe chaxingu]|uniref:Uncharacterized protein n=1 Tax=Agrocybe chaxingu TaxID=84603 RepID=A0A9W8MYY1_9AGAR|nr:hypothetical protein NLJ89_g2124 [Agrocybe chaxingu]